MIGGEIEMNRIPVSNKAWRKSHLFENGSLVNVLQKHSGKKINGEYVWVDKNNHKVELVEINGKFYRK